MYCAAKLNETFINVHIKQYLAFLQLNIEAILFLLFSSFPNSNQPIVLYVLRNIQYKNPYNLLLPFIFTKQNQTYLFL